MPGAPHSCKPGQVRSFLRMFRMIAALAWR
jgi:hypothetical protein